MLKTHIDAREATLLAISQVPAGAGHPLHKGTPREAFIREFLEGHLSERVAIGTGELIDSNSVPNPPQNQQRNQFDIVLYKRDFPRLDIGGGINAFLAESVVATIEVKSTLNQQDMQQAVRAARQAKSLTRNVVTSFLTGYHPPSILSYVVAYDGPAHMNTVHGWLAPIHANLGIPTPQLAPTLQQRLIVPSPSVDGVFVLDKGFVVFDNSPISFVTDQLRQQNPNANWHIVDVQRGSLLLFFLLLTTAVSGVSASWLNPLPYLANFAVSGGAFAP